MRRCGLVRAALPVDGQGRVAVADPAGRRCNWPIQETGVMQDLPPGLAVSDLTQASARCPWPSTGWAARWGCLGAQAGRAEGNRRAGGAAGGRGAAQLKGGGQEMGRRAGTENLIGIAGFAAAAEAAARDLADGVWDEVAELEIF
jgi:cysteine desulfurase